MKTEHRSRNPRNQRGLSLIELLVALTIGSFLIIGAVTLQSQTRRTFDVTERQARLQETARYVLSVLDTEIQLAGLYGYSQDPNVVRWENIPAGELRQVSAGVPAGVPASLNDCGDNFAIDVLATVEARENTYDLICAAEGGGAVADSDTLIIRRSGTANVAASATRLQLFTNRLSPNTSTQLVVSSTPPEPLEANLRSMRNMMVQAYYVAQDADGRPGTPALRVKLLDTVGGAPGFIDQEIIRGVEDIQVQFGIDPGLDLNGDGFGDDPGGDGMADFVNGEIGQWVDPDDALLTSSQVVAVRIWVRVRAEEPEAGFEDNREYAYGSVIFEPNDGFRRVLMSRTIFLRNSRQQ